MLIRHFSFIVAVMLTGCAADQAVSPTADLTMAYFRKTTTQTTVGTENRVKLSTEQGYEEPYDSPRDFKSSYLIATLDRNTGAAGFALNVMDVAIQPRAKAKVTYESPEGWMEQTVRVQSGVRKCRDGDCWNLESIAVGLKEDLLRAYAKRHASGAAGAWQYRIEPNISGQIAYAEIAGLLARVDEYRANVKQNP
jgi:hypothetical protein